MVKYRIEHQHLVFSVDEDLTVHNISEFTEVFEKALEKTKIYNVILEAHNITMADSSGIGMLVSQYKRLKDKGGSISLVGATKGMLEILRITRLDSILMPMTDLEKALNDC